MQPARGQITGKEALKLLFAGNKKFLAGKPEHPNHCEESRRGLTAGQNPIAVILTCADSRVPPVDVFDQGLEIFLSSGWPAILLTIISSAVLNMPCLISIHRLSW